ncbi:MAG TPA: hypothetical protein VGC12_00805 [Methyloradius sp.]
MNVEATKKTAFFTGIWSAVGFSSLDTYEHLHPLSIETNNIMFFVGSLLFLVVPFILFIAGPQYFRFGIKPTISKEYLLAFRAVTFRMLFWFFGGAIGLVAFGLVESYLAT